MSARAYPEGQHSGTVTVHPPGPPSPWDRWLLDRGYTFMMEELRRKGYKVYTPKQV